jgi:hypothetical protein
MEKHILTWSYWLGIVCTVIALVLRLLGALGLFLPQVAKSTPSIGYMSFYKGAVLFLVIAVATASYTWARSQRS